MENKQQNHWPSTTLFIVVALAAASIVWAGAWAHTHTLEAEVKNNKNRIEYDQWLLENDYIKEPRIK